VFNPDINSPLNRTVVVVIGLLFIGFGLASFRNIGLSYHNWWNGAVFGPFAVIVGILFIVFMLKLGSRQSEMRKHPRKSAKRIRR
jgi:uncharacterized membrane protein HdeD (DUF308 family)